MLTGRIKSAEKLHLNFLTDDSRIVEIIKDSIDEIIRFQDLPATKKKSINAQPQPDTTKYIEYEDKNLSRMVIFPTARPLKAGQAYFQLNELFLPFIAFGIADIFTIGGGASILPPFKQQLFYLSPKITALHYENFYLAGGLFYAKWMNDDFLSNLMEDGFGISYALGTFGDKDKSVTFGFGYGFSGKEFSNKPVVIFGGGFRVSRGLKLIAEGWFPQGSNYFFGMFGFRAIGKNFCGDAVMMRNYGSGLGRSRFVPWFNITYNFDLIK